MNPKAKGEISEAKVLAALVSHDYPVSIPFGNNQRYDLIVDVEGELLKVQVKTCNWRNGCVEFCASSKNGFTGERRQYAGDVDLFLVYSPHLDEVLALPVEAKHVVTLRVDPPKGGATGGVRWATDYKFDAETDLSALAKIARW